VIAAEVVSVNVNIDTSVAENIESFGIASACADNVEEVTAIFIRGIAENLIAAEIANRLNNVVQDIASAAHGFDSRHRTYALTSVDLTDASLTLTVCPLPILSPLHTTDSTAPLNPIHWTSLGVIPEAWQQRSQLFADRGRVRGP